MPGIKNICNGDGTPPYICTCVKLNLDLIHIFVKMLFHVYLIVIYVGLPKIKIWPYFVHVYTYLAEKVDIFEKKSLDF